MLDDSSGSKTIIRGAILCCGGRTLRDLLNLLNLLATPPSFLNPGKLAASIVEDEERGDPQHYPGTEQTDAVADGKMLAPALGDSAPRPVRQKGHEWVAGVEDDLGMGGRDQEVRNNEPEGKSPVGIYQGLKVLSGNGIIDLLIVQVNEVAVIQRR